MVRASIRVFAVLAFVAAVLGLYARLTFLSGQGIIEALRAGNTWRVAYLLRQDSERVRALDGSGRPILHDAVKIGSGQMVRLLLDRGADVDARDLQGRAALHVAAEQSWFSHDWYEIMEALVEAGADVNAKDRFGITPLHVAIGAGDYPGELSADVRGRFPEVKLLLAAGADVSAADASGLTALHYSAQSWDSGLWELLAYESPAASLAYSAGCDLLHWVGPVGEAQVLYSVVRSGENLNLRWAAAIGDAALVSDLLQEDPGRLHARDAWGRTVLHWAAATGEAAVLDLLLRKGAEADARDKLGITPLMLATREAHVPIVEILVRNGADVNARAGNGRTALHFAAGNGHLEVTRVLLARGAKAEARSDRGRTPAELAGSAGYEQVVKLLREHGATE